MRIILAPQGTHGDVRPLVALAAALREAGHNVLFGASPNHRGWIEELGFPFHAVGLDMDAPSAEADQSMGKPLRNVLNGLTFINTLVPAQFEALEKLAAEADLIIGSGLEFAARSLAEKFRIPYRFVCHVPSAIRSRFHPPLAIPYRVFPSWVNRLLWWSNTLGTKWTFGRGIQANRRRLGLEPVRDFGAFLGAGVVLAADEALAPVPPDCRFEFRTSYLALDDARPLPPNLERFLASGPPPVYIGFGSMRDPNPAQTLRAFEALSRSFRLVVSSARARRLASPELPNIEWVDSVPHSSLFPRVAAVVHHGGAGTTHTAARAGVPQVVVPHLVDQYYWAYRVRELGVGPASIRRHELSGATLEAALAQVAPGSPIERSAVALAQRLAQPATQSRGDMVQYVQRVAARL